MTLSLAAELLPASVTDDWRQLASTPEEARIKQSTLGKWRPRSFFCCSSPRAPEVLALLSRSFRRFFFAFFSQDISNQIDRVNRAWRFINSSEKQQRREEAGSLKSARQAPRLNFRRVLRGPSGSASDSEAKESLNARIITTSWPRRSLSPRRDVPMRLLLCRFCLKRSRRSTDTVSLR